MHRLYIFRRECLQVIVGNGYITISCIRLERERSQELRNKRWEGGDEIANGRGLGT